MWFQKENVKLPFQQSLNISQTSSGKKYEDMAATECVSVHQSLKKKRDIFDNQPETSTDSEKTDSDWSTDEQSPANTDTPQGDKLEHISELSSYCNGSIVKRRKLFPENTV